MVVRRGLFLSSQHAAGHGGNLRHSGPCRLFRFRVGEYSPCAGQGTSAAVGRARPDRSPDCLRPVSLLRQQLSHTPAAVAGTARTAGASRRIRRQVDRPLYPMNSGRRLSCSPACSMNGSGVCMPAWNRCSWVEIARLQNSFIWTRTPWPKDEGNCWHRMWRRTACGPWVEDANRWEKNARRDRGHPQADGKGNRWRSHQRVEVDQEDHRQDRSTTQAVRDCRQPQHRGTAAAADAVLPAHQPQDDFRRLYFRPRPPVPLSLPAEGPVRKARLPGPERRCQKKRELIGNFKNSGVKWEQTSTAVNDHDFRSAAQGIGIPYGIYDTQANRGCVFLGTSHETSAFAVSCLRKWWQTEGRKRYPHSSHILILADTGGSNGARRGAWKQEIQRQLCDGLGLRVTVSHYPSGASKWNPIEHRLFSQISRNWAAEPLDSYEKALKFIRTTTTTTGLKVTARLDTTYYPTGVKVSKQDLAQLSIRQKRILPKWNYTISPQM